ncbi:MAG: hypothetical protein JEZ07_17300 [Phycisphaerae bacterium]|nr:hypothetical protein [Phycisphaerae bacterium]
MTQDNNQKPNNSLLNRWQNGQLRESKFATNFALTIFLLLAIACAYLIIGRANSATQINRDAQKLVDEVAANGLDYYFGNQNHLSFYFIINDNTTVGYLIDSITPILKDDKISYQGQSIYRIFSDNSSWQTQWNIANDLSTFNATQIVKENKSLYQTKQTMKNGKIKIDGQTTRKYLGPVTVTIDQYPGLIPYFMEDFFISIAAGRENVKFTYLHGNPKIRYFIEPVIFTAGPGGNVPADIQDQFPDSHSAEFEMAGFTMDMLFNANNILLWQKTNKTTITSVKYEQIAQQFGPTFIQDLQTLGISPNP